MVKPHSLLLYYLLCIVLVLSAEIASARRQQQSTMKSAVYLSPEFVMEPGSVANKFYYNIDFPKGHIGIKSFNAEVVDEFGVPVPLHETYLHHWLVVRYYLRVGFQDKGLGSNPELHHRSDFQLAGNSGLCDENVLGQYFGLGSETRKTATYVPDPYAIEVGNSAKVPPGFEERWLLNVHAIDTRGVVDRLGCTECKCDLYNVTVDEYGRHLRPDYDGGLYCCYDQTQCKVKEGFGHSTRKLYLRYTVKWIDWDESVLPVEIYIFDITATLETSKNTAVSTANAIHHCKIEYEIETCESSAVSVDGCIDSKRLTFVMPRGGYVIYGVAHQHAGGIGAALYRKDGQVICSSMPSYGTGQEAGNETGYIVGMSTCYPQPGSVELLDGETLVLESNYSSSQKHTGVMGLFYILVADQLPSQRTSYEAPNYVGDIPVSAWVLLIGGLALVALAAVGYQRNQQEDGYQAITT